MPLIRDFAPEDAAQMARIYASYVETTAFTFEEEAPSQTEMALRMEKVRQAGLPCLVAEAGGGMAGYAYAAPFHTRSAYRFTVENSVYVARERAREGIGTLLMQALIAECAGRGLRQMIARIGDRENIPSIRLHEKLGFRRVGELSAVGFKFGRWLDVVEMQLLLEPPLQ
jgi:phosphinothricin acetyltransferase